MQHAHDATGATVNLTAANGQGSGLVRTPGELAWQLSSYTDSGSCVEVARPPGTVLVRDSKRRDGPRVQVQPATWTTLMNWLAE